MSLKWFHLAFITLSMLVTLGFGVWGLLNQQIALAVVSLAGSAGLTMYGTYFFGKAKRL